MDTDAPAPDASTKGTGSSDKTQDAAMDVDDGARASSTRPESEKKDEPAPMQADDEEAVEY